MKQRITTLLLSITLILLMAIPAFAIDDVNGGENEGGCSHEWSEWVVEEEATCGTDGIETRTCSICNETEEQEIPATGAHDWSGWTTTAAATIKKAGSKEHSCYICGKTEKAAIGKLSAFAKFGKKTYTVKKGKSLKLVPAFANGDKIKSWKSSKKSVAKVNKYGKVVGKKKGKAKITVTMQSGKKATCTVKVVKPKKVKKTAAKASGGKVYWTPSGSVYHLDRNCSTLSRSKVIKSGTIKQSGKKRACKVCG